MEFKSISRSFRGWYSIIELKAHIKFWSPHQESNLIRQIEYWPSAFRHSSHRATSLSSAIDGGDPSSSLAFRGDNLAGWNGYEPLSSLVPTMGKPMMFSLIKLPTHLERRDGLEPPTNRLKTTALSLSYRRIGAPGWI
jgi:hypothetical protein